MKNYILLSLILLVHNLFSQRIENVRYWQSEDKFKITYDLVGVSFYKVVNIKLIISTDGGKTYNDSLTNVIGDFGNNISEGKYKTILCDIPKGINGLSKNIVLDVKAEVINSKFKKTLYIAYSCSNHAPLGLQFGIIGGRIGCYLDFKINKNIFQKYDYERETFAPDQFIEFGKKYKYTGVSAQPRLSVTTGINFQIIKNIYISTGCGYGVDNLLYRIVEYDMADYVKDINWIKLTEYSQKGFEIDASLRINYKFILLNIGTTIMNLNKIYYSLGIGYVFL